MEAASAARAGTVRARLGAAAATSCGNNLCCRPSLSIRLVM